MAAPDPDKIFKQAAAEGKRRLDQSVLALLATGFIAGFTIVFGSVAQALVHSHAQPHFGEFATVLGALAFAIGLVFLILGRAELFSENFFDPIATAFEGKQSHLIRRLLRLWVLTFLLNLIGGAILILVLSVDGALHEGARHSIVSLATELANRAPLATLARSFVGGALVALLSFLVIAGEKPGARAAAAFAVGFLLALGPFEHVVVSTLHMFFGFAVGADLDPVRMAEVAGIALVGNLVGGVGLVTLSHAAQAKGEEQD